MNEEEIIKHEGKPVKIILTDGKTIYYGTYENLDKEVLFTDRRRQTFSISKIIIGLIEPVDKIIYQGEP